MQPLANRCAELSSGQARWTLALLFVVALAGCSFSWKLGNLPRREPPRETGRETQVNAAQSAGEVAPDLQLYRDVVAAVARGENYYVAARPQLLKHGFPIHSTFNWRLPTYAWLFSFLPGPWAVQALLVLLAAAGLTLHFQAELTPRGLTTAIVSALLLVGVVKWSVDGLAFYTQELWASVLILISVGAYGKLGSTWRGLAIAAGIAALMFRELALPYCLWAGWLACFYRRWWEASGWLLGIACFFLFLQWHSQQVAAQLTPADLPIVGGGIQQWLKFGGLDFVLLTTRMNSLLFAAPGPVLFLYLLAALLGLGTARDERLTLQLLAAVSYLAAFCVVGMTVNFYWGLLVAPLLPAGVAAAGDALRTLWQRAGNSAPGGASAAGSS